MNIKQKKILSLLTTRNGCRYSELYKGFTEEDKFPYHLKQLNNKGFVNKRDNLYYLTRYGAHETQEFNQTTLEDKKLKIPINIFICEYQGKYLIREIFKEDKNVNTHYALPGIKAEWGTKYNELFNNLVLKKFGVKVHATYRSTFHLLEYTLERDIMFDDLLVVFDCEVSEVLDKQKQNLWLSKEEIATLTEKHPPIDTFILDHNREPFGEIYVLSNYNLRKEDL